MEFILWLSRLWSGLGFNWTMSVCAILSQSQRYDYPVTCKVKACIHVVFLPHFLQALKLFWQITQTHKELIPGVCPRPYCILLTVFCSNSLHGVITPVAQIVLNAWFNNLSHHLFQLRHLVHVRSIPVVMSWAHDMRLRLLDYQWSYCLGEGVRPPVERIFAETTK